MQRQSSGSHQLGQSQSHPPLGLLCPLQEMEAQEARLQARTDELTAVERRIAGAQQRLEGEAERLKAALAAVEEEGAALKVRASECLSLE